MDHTMMSSIRGGRVIKLGINNNNNDRCPIVLQLLMIYMKIIDSFMHASVKRLNEIKVVKKYIGVVKYTDLRLTDLNKCTPKFTKIYHFIDAKIPQMGIFVGKKFPK
jgi:hypothetical protein